ncbi:MAG TPA: alpha-L-arabinofuranosidase C-terminal domain-containing protein [Thermomicrobiales bacterium]|jgi:alpha-N-arabinofuranosidase|nr:alpha-L-arabinofuranosidase C-terminal domain-containing protein [Thermomicrobiales bacterium]
MLPRPTAHIDIHPNDGIGRVDPEIYGHFLESAFFGNIEGGVFDEGSPLAHAGPGPLAGAREDVIAACRELGVPIVRWPGGNFTSSYRWQDGIGPRDDRPRRLDLNWGGEESNRFGTDEFLAWCEAIGAKPYLAHSARDVEDAARWVEYTNYRGDTEMTRQRRSNGRAEPWRVRTWGVGNEVYGSWQMGQRSARRYAEDAREHARFMRRVDPAIRTVGVGWEREEWTRPVLEVAGRDLDLLSIHLYGGSGHLYAPGDDRDHFAAIVSQAVHVERELLAYADMVAELSERSGLERPPRLAFDEWNMRHLEPTDWPEPERGDRGGIAPRDESAMRMSGDGPRRYRVNRYSPRTLADALYYAGVFHAMQRMSGHTAAVTMANTVNLVNANGLLEVRPGGLVRSATYHVWSLMQHQTGPIAVRATVEAPGVIRSITRDPHPLPDGSFPSRPGYVPYLDVSATRSADGTRLHLSVINRDPSRPITARLTVDGATDRLPAMADVHELGADTGGLLDHNTMDRPDVIGVRSHPRVPLGEGGTYPFPPHSVSVLTFAMG